MIELGLIEGFYGKPWTWSERAANVEFLAPHGYRFYLYAPKADPYLRREWRMDHPESVAAGLAGLAEQCRRLDVRFGVGLTPYELHLAFDEAGRADLERKLRFLDELAIDDLGILFDDMRGDLPDLAERQAAIVDFAAARTGAGRIIVCPSYYTDDPVLDRVFGRRPPEYLEQLGALLDPRIEIFWTGEEVCSREISPAHVHEVTERIGRRPLLWDNYPVNDGQRMSQYLHLRAFTGRSAELSTRIAAHGINPALQPVLTRIPALTLEEVYRRGGDYAYGQAFRRAAHAVLGPELGEMLRDDLLLLQDVGLDRLDDRSVQIRSRYAPYDHPGAGEILAWLAGDYRITEEIVQTQ